MKRLFWIGSPFFSAALPRHGWEVCSVDFQHLAVYRWEDIVRMAGWEPDVVVVADKSRPPFVVGMEDFPCLTVFYCVDSHIHSWYPYYAQGFDVCLMSLRDHIPQMLSKNLPPERILWTPAFAKDTDLPETPAPKWDVLFVGNVDPVRTPVRHTFLAALQERVPGLAIKQGDYRALYPQGRILLNFCERGDLNFRVFETLGCGGCLVTPRIGHGLTELFTEGESLALYSPDDLDGLVRLLEELLGEPEYRARMAKQGLATINAGHRAEHRAANFTDAIRNIPPAIINTRRARAALIHTLWLRPIYLLFAEQLEQPELRQAYLEAGCTRPKPEHASRMMAALSPHSNTP